MGAAHAVTEGGSVPIFKRENHMNANVELPVTCIPPPRVTTVELVLARTKRAIREILVAAHEARRMQAARVIHQYRHLCYTTVDKQTEPCARAERSFASKAIWYGPIAKDANVAIPKTDLARILPPAKASHASQ